VNEAEGSWRGWFRPNRRREVIAPVPAAPEPPPKIGLALGGGFARGMAHIGVLQVLEDESIPIDFIAGVSAGAIVAAAYASGSTPQEIAKVSMAMRFGDVARWTLCKLGFCCTDGMQKLLARLLKRTRFEEMRLPLAVSATDLQTGEPVVFSGSGDMLTAIRASCAFPGIFQPVRSENRILTDGAVSMEVPARIVRDMGAERVISVWIPYDSTAAEPANLFEVVTRSLQILQRRMADSWRGASDVVIAPQVSEWSWHDFRNSSKMIEAGAAAARAALPEIRSWLNVGNTPRAVEDAPASAYRFKTERVVPVCS
jgi:NTE family protein